MPHTSVRISMSKFDHSDDLTSCEGFPGLLKRGRVHHRNYRTLDKSRADLFDLLSDANTAAYLIE